MVSGTVKWFNKVKGFGFIEPEEGNEDIFVHISELKKNDLSSLNDGDKVEFEIANGPKGNYATEIKKV